MSESKRGLIKYPENLEVNKLLKKGERIEVAKLAGVSVSYARQVLVGERSNDLVIACARRIIKDRLKRIDEIIG